MTNHLTSALTSTLNGAQHHAVTMPPGPALVLAGAGSGKTRVITHRIAWLVEEGHAQPDQILAMTFTNRAAAEMRERIQALCPAAARRSMITTFHSACARWLRTYAPLVGLSPQFSIYDTDDQKGVVKRCAKDLSMPFDAASLRIYLQKIDRAHNQALTPKDLETQARSNADEEFADLFRAYHDALRQAAAVDFGSLITTVLHLLESNDRVRARFHDTWKHILVDEFQDTNTAQYRLLRALAPTQSSVMIVGDDDQSIYGWRGAEVENVRRFLDDYAPVELIKLEQNYRSLAPILDAAHALVAPLPVRIDKTLIAEREGARRPTLRVALDDRDEAEFIAHTIGELIPASRLRFDDVAIFYRTNAQSRIFEQKLRAANIPYRVVGSVGFFDRKEVKDVVAWLRISVNPADDAAFERIVNTPPRGIGATTLALLQRHRETHTHWIDALESADAALPKRTSKKTRAGIHELHETLVALKDLAESMSAAELLETILSETRYFDWLRGAEGESFEERARNVEELIHAARDLERDHEDASPQNFMEHIALESGRDDGDDGDAVQLMTVHTSKGLEFPAVFVTGLEEKLFPLERRDTPIDDATMEEERRLAYVALTRAKDYLFLSAARTRQLYGQLRRSEASVFLRELIDTQKIDFDDTSTLTHLDWHGRQARTESGDAWSSGGGESWESSATSGSFKSNASSRWDDFDQSDWSESSSPRRGSPAKGRSVIPEEGVIFDDSYYPQAQVSEARDRWEGRRVFHKTFGKGTIVSADATGDRVRLSIRFDSGDERKVIANYVTLL